MRIDFEDLQLYTRMDHKKFEALLENHHENILLYFEQCGGEEEWFYKSCPYYIYDVLCSRDIGIYEIWYDYIKRRVVRGSTVLDYGAGVGSLEVMLLKRSPAALSVIEHNLLCMAFISWRMYRHGGELAPLLDHYDYVVSLDLLQRMPPERIKSTLAWLLSLGDRCFIYINGDDRHPLFNEVPFDVEVFLTRRAKSVKNFHGLWDVIINEK